LLAHSQPPRQVGLRDSLGDPDPAMKGAI
jgi:hypothetical protein